MCDDILFTPGQIKRPKICPGCSGKITLIKQPACLKCGKKLEDDAQEYCSDCMRKNHVFDRGVAVFSYTDAMKKSMYAFKYNNRREYAGFYAECALKSYERYFRLWKPEVIVPVPLHKARYRRRGYNQAEILARHFGKLSGLPVGTEMIARIKDTRPQKELSAGERKRNLAGAFSVGRQVRELNQIPECVIIMDDIYTTGSTMEACSAVLKETGIRRIYFLCVCIGQGN